MSELKPCPFCGGSVNIVEAGDENGVYWLITRGSGENACRCRVFMESDSFFDREEEKKERQQLIAAWNRRAE